jgi:hypothetical protein
MIRRYVAAAGAASTLAAASPAGAAAKGVPASVGLCGPSACVHISDRSVLLAIAGTEGETPAPAPTLAPSFRLTTRPQLFGLTGYLISSQGVAVLCPGTYRLGPRVLALIRARLAAVAPNRPRVGRVWVGGRSHGPPIAIVLGVCAALAIAAAWRRPRPLLRGA